ncbi:MAG TPA: type II toxin-antitoxin system Phd/YefM family antitoxin [Gemmatimonadota bacterium]|nr:type II toxin-antitoxin system Phd/YefM family antitoxin [Gemmatimonadota bacterium]
MNEPAERVAISKFKATCFAVLEQVRRTGKPVIVTKHGQPIAEVIPPSPPTHDPGWLGSMRGTARCVGDIVSPASDPEEWEALGSQEE